MDQSIFSQISLVLVIVAAVSLVMRLLKQPLIMGYILTGIVVGPSVLNLIHSKEAFQGFSEIGIALLLFIIGLSLNAAVIKNVGKVALVTAISILVLVGATGFSASELLGFSVQEGLIIGIGLFFSSTIIILKVLSDKRETSRLYAQIAIGVILIDDIVATLALLTVAAVGTTGGLSITDVGLLVAKGAGLAALLYVTSAHILPRLSKLFANSQELLFLFAIAWGFGIASLFSLAGFSHEVGALFAGVSLASLPYATEMGTRLKPLRDFFIVLFFVSLGETFSFGALSQSLIPALVLSAIVIVGKPLFVIASLGALGYTRMTSFKAGIHLSQISEFSIILVVFAHSFNLVDARATALITLIALITIAVSTYLMNYDDEIFAKLEKHLHVFERKVIKADKRSVQSFPLVLFGYQRGGHEFVKTFRDMHKRFAVVDYNPEVIETLEHQGIHYVYGDATDLQLLEEIGIERSKLVVSTMSDFATNVSLAKHLKKVNPKVVFICPADSYEETSELYSLDVSYVMMPHMIGSERISGFIKRHGTSQEAFDNYRERHIVMIGRKALE